MEDMTKDIEMLKELKRELELQFERMADSECEFGEERHPRLEETLAFLDEMVGMEPIREKLMRLGRYQQWKDDLECAGVDTDQMPKPNLTYLFVGDPGTGKTTVANRMGEILYSMGLLKSPEVYVYRREDLIGENYGSEEKNTRDALEKSEGAVLFLDEAYQCFKGGTDRRDPGYHVLETLMAQFDQPGRCIIMAGYKSEMMEMMKVNAGFRSRIPEENVFEFTGPTEQALMDIVALRLRQMNLRMSPGAKQLMRANIREQLARKDGSFGNARTIRQMLDQIVITHADRVMQLGWYDTDPVIGVADVRPCLRQCQNAMQQKTRARIGFA